MTHNKKPIRIVFCGTPDFAVAPFEALRKAGHEIAAVYTQPPRPKGRGQETQKSPVHATAEDAGIPVFTPEKLRRNPEAQRQFAAHDADIAVVVAYGLILPREILEAPRHGCVNIHASLLPRWRGAAPIQYAIWKGDHKTGVSIMQMEEGLDTGPVISMREIPITEDTTATGLHDALSALGAAMIVEALDALSRRGSLASAPQDDAASTYASMLKKEDGIIDWARPAADIDRQIRALNPWPGVWTKTDDGKRLKILSAQVADTVPGTSANAAPGTVVGSASGGLVVCGDGTALRIQALQPENGRRMDAAGAFNGGYVRAGQKLGS